MTDAKGASAPGFQTPESSEERADRYSREAAILVRMSRDCHNSGERLTARYFWDLAQERRVKVRDIRHMLRESGDG